MFLFMMVLSDDATLEMLSTRKKQLCIYFNFFIEYNHFFVYFPLHPTGLIQVKARYGP